MAYEINSALNHEEGLSNFTIFQTVISNVWKYYTDSLGSNLMDTHDLFIDNVKAYCGPTPYTYNILNKIILIKLDIESNTPEYQIAYIFCHELMHFVYYCKYGMLRTPVIEEEERICSASSLIYIKHFYPDYFYETNVHVKNLQNEYYAEGASLAEELSYNFLELIKLI